MLAKFLRLFSAVICSFAVCAGARAAPAIAVFPFEFVDTSGENPSPDRDARLKMATSVLSEALEKTGRYTSVDLGQFHAEIDAMAPRYQCGDCFLAVARKAGAAFAAVSVIHKVSTLISSMDIGIFDVSNGAFLADLSGQIRGDTDEAYRHGVKFLVRNRLPDEIPVGGGNPK